MGGAGNHRSFERTERRRARWRRMTRPRRRPRAALMRMYSVMYTTHIYPTIQTGTEPNAHRQPLVWSPRFTVDQLGGRHVTLFGVGPNTLLTLHSLCLLTTEAPRPSPRPSCGAAARARMNHHTPPRARCHRTHAHTHHSFRHAAARRRTARRGSSSAGSSPRITSFMYG